MSESQILEPRDNPYLIGHERAEQAFLGAWTSGRLAHAWLICGPRGIGQATLAYRMARFVLSRGQQ
ncbi:MAG: DNA polymerase III subunit delta', partial [Rhodospirillaceae bacterium]